MPKRPLSAYNLFFKARREAIMLAAEGTSSSDNKAQEEGLKRTRRRSSKKKSTGVGFANLARTIATEWKILEAQERVPYETIAAVDKERYAKEMVVWRAKEKKEKIEKSAKLKEAPAPITKKTGIDYAIGIPTVASPRQGQQREVGGGARVENNQFINNLQQSINTHDIGGLFQSSIHSNASSNFSDSMDIPTLSDTTRMQLSEFTNAIIREQNQNDTAVNNIAAYTNSMEVQSSQLRQQYENQYLLPFVSAGTGNSGGGFSGGGDNLENNLTRNPRNLMANMLGTSIDNYPGRQPHQFPVAPNDRAGLVSNTNNTSRQHANRLHRLHNQNFDPLLLSGNDQQLQLQQLQQQLQQQQRQQQQHEQQQQLQQQLQQQQQQLGETMFADRRNSWSGKSQSLEQTQAMLRMTAISGAGVPFNEEYAQRLTISGPSLSLSPAVGTWFERNTDIQDEATAGDGDGGNDDNEPNRRLTGDGNLNQKLPGRSTSTTTNRHPQDEGGDTTHGIQRNKTRSSSLSTVLSQQDPWKSIEGFSEEKFEAVQCAPTVEEVTVIPSTQAKEGVGDDEQNDDDEDKSGEKSSSSNSSQRSDEAGTTCNDDETKL